MSTVSKSNRRSYRGHFSRLCILLVLWAFIQPALASPLSAWQQEADRFGEGPWEHLGVEKGVALARKKLPQIGLFAVRGEVVLPAPMAKIARVIYDESRWAEWSDRTSEAVMLSQGPGNMKTVYQAVDMPFILSDRDVIYTFGYEHTADSVTIIGRTLPYRKPPRSVGVRMHLVEGRWFLRSKGENQTHLVLEILMDPRGDMPNWFVNLVQKDYPVGLVLLQI